MKPSRTALIVIAAIAVTALVGFLVISFPGALTDDDDQIHLVRLGIVLALIMSGIVAAPRLKLKGALKSLVIWLGLGIIVMTGYAYRDDFRMAGRKLMGETMPFRVQETPAGELVLQRGSDGHFHVAAEVDGTPVRFLIDTGASDVSLSQADAKRIGFETKSLKYTRRYNTANGTVWAAPVRLKRVRVGPLTLTDVSAAVNDSDMSGSLLGISFLSRLKGYRVEGDKMVLTP